MTLDGAPSLEPPYGARDPGDMAALIAGQPRQIEEALEGSRRLADRVAGCAPALVAVGGLGGSAIAADLTAGAFHDRLARPLVTVRDYRWPACVTREALLVLSSFSGETEETLSLYRQGGELGAARVAITSGGTLAAWCERDRIPWARLVAPPPPRSAVFATWVPLTALLAALGWVDDPAPGWREAAALLRARGAELGVEVLERANPAKRLARALGGRFVFLYAGTARTGPAATRMRQQLHENAKMLGHSAVVPELNHNEIVGWERGGPPGPAAVVLLRDAEDTAETRTRLTLTGEYAARQGAAVYEVDSSGEGRLARLASLVQFGDYLSLYLALVNGVDPSPIASIDEFKRRLAAAAGRPAEGPGA